MNSNVKNRKTSPAYALGCVLAVIPLGLFLSAGCGDSQRTGYARETRIVGEPVSTDTDVNSNSGTVYREESSETTTPSSRDNITLDEMRGHVRDRSAVIIDARSPEDFARGHVRGAINVPARQKENYIAQLKKDYTKAQLFVIYCGGPQCPAGEIVYDYLDTQGFTNMRVFKPGWQTLSAEKDLLQ